MQHKFCPIVQCSTSLRQTITQQKLKHQLQRCIKICFFFCSLAEKSVKQKKRRRRGKQGHRHDSAGGLVAAQHQHPSLSCCKIHRTNCWFCGTIKIPWKREREKKTENRSNTTLGWEWERKGARTRRAGWVETCGCAQMSCSRMLRLGWGLI